MKIIPKARKLDHLIGKARNRIFRVGIELEGGWIKLPMGTNLTHDGSVQFADRIRRDNAWGHDVQIQVSPDGTRYIAPVPLPQQPPNSPQHIGEIPSPPMLLDKWKEWVKQFYPPFVNDTCGLHIHMSFKSALNYSRLMVPDYQETILHYLILWGTKEKIPPQHPFWPRVLGKNQYCKKEFMAQEQAERREKSHSRTGIGNRYTAINYPYGQLQTVECRVLPMFEDVEQSIQALEVVISTTNAFLLSDVKREPRHNAIVEGDDDTFREEHIECV